MHSRITPSIPLDILPVVLAAVLKVLVTPPHPTILTVPRLRANIQLTHLVKVLLVVRLSLATWLYRSTTREQPSSGSLSRFTTASRVPVLAPTHRVRLSTRILTSVGIQSRTDPVELPTRLRNVLTSTVTARTLSSSISATRSLQSRLRNLARSVLFRIL